jgi:hypothetical protein
MLDCDGCWLRWPCYIGTPSRPRATASAGLDPLTVSKQASAASGDDVWFTDNVTAIREKKGRLLLDDTTCSTCMAGPKCSVLPYRCHPKGLISTDCIKLLSCTGSRRLSRAQCMLGGRSDLRRVQRQTFPFRWQFSFQRTRAICRVYKYSIAMANPSVRHGDDSSNVNVLGSSFHPVL